MTDERDPTDPTDNPATDFAADCACDLGDALMPRIRAAAYLTDDRATFWSCLLQYLVGAMNADLGHEAARAIVVRLGGAREGDGA